MTGFKDFTDGSPLTASDINNYLMQGVLVFDSASARDTALSGNNREGRVAYLKDTNTTTVYDGSNWLVISSPTATVSGTTGSPTVDTSSRPGKTIYKFTSSSGSISIATAGTAEILVVGGGGGPGNGTTEMTGGGGAGGMLYMANAYIPAGTAIVTVGAGGAVGYNGGPSQLGPYVGAGGGVGAQTRLATGGAGGSGGGGGDNGGTGGAGLSGQGNNGGNGGTNPGGGGGGAGGAGSNTGARGAGLANSITGASVTYAQGGKGGGDGNAAVASAANLGKGGDAGDTGSSVAGGSGIVIFVI